MSEHNIYSLLKNHSLNYIQMALSTDNIEKIEHPDGYGKQTGKCGDTIEFFILKKGKNIDTVSFIINGCLNTMACGNAVVRLARGKTIEFAWEIKSEHVIAFLGTLPADHHHCAELAVGAFYHALKELK